MSTESPESYGEVFARSQYDARQYQDELDGEDFIQYIPNIFGTSEMEEAIPFDFATKWKALIASPSAQLGGIGGGLVGGAASEITGRMLSPGLKKFDYAANRFFEAEFMPIPEAINMGRRKRFDVEERNRRMGNMGFSDTEASLYYEATRPEIAVPDWIRWGRYHGDPRNLWATLFPKVDFDPTDWPIHEWLSQPQFTVEQILNLFKRGQMGEILAPEELLQLGWSIEKHPQLMELSYTIPNAMILMQGNLLAGADQAEIFTDFGHADIHPSYHQKYFDAVLTKPAAQDFIRYHLRQDDDLQGLDSDLRKIGIHPAYNDVYRTLAHPIPPIADLITMAVREAFSPEVARRFGQFEDFPEPFADYARKQGMTEDWAKRYWAAHWNLPSPQQGFEMLHRGVISFDDLQLLLRSQDVMPFWRDKLTAIAYRPLTRVDVRRMYKEGVLSESEVMESYLNQGYDETNAARMTEFTVRSTLASLAKFTATDILRAYTNGVITKSVTGSLLREIGTKSEDVALIMRYAEYKRDWDYTQDRVGAIGNLYRKEVINENAARAQLGQLNLPSEQVQNYMDRWYSEAAEKAPNTWTKAETLKFLKTGVIDKVRAKQELVIMGYDDEHIDAYLGMVTE